jgi:hypothetical protein
MLTWLREASPLGPEQGELGANFGSSDAFAIHDLLTSASEEMNS